MKSFLLSVVSCLLLCGANVQAGSVIFDNSNNISGFDSISFSDLVFGQEIATQFSPVYNATLKTVEFWGGNFSWDKDEVTQEGPEKSFQIGLYEGQSFDVVIKSEISTSFVEEYDANTGFFKYLLAFDDVQLHQGNAYWLSIVNTSFLGENLNWVWAGVSTGDSNISEGRSQWRSIPGGHSLKLTGEVTKVNEPTSMMLIFLGLLVVFIKNRKYVIFR